MVSLKCDIGSTGPTSPSITGVTGPTGAVSFGKIKSISVN